MFRRSTITPKKSRRFSFGLSKRKKFVLIAFTLSIGVLLIQSSPLGYRYYFIGVLTLLTSLFSGLALKDDMKKIGWVMALILPAFFTVSVNLFYFLLPENLIVRLVLVSLFAIGMYALLLTENIFVVASLRTIQLFRAAQALGFVFTLLVAFLMFDSVFSFRLDPWINALLVMVTSFPLLLQAVWSCKLEDYISRDVLQYTLALTFILAQFAFFVSFWPMTIIMASLLLVSMMYVGLGIVQQAMIGRLFKKTIYEYLRVGFVVLVIVLISTQWGA